MGKITLDLCRLRFCRSGKSAAVRVDEIIGDGNFATWICRPCANALEVSSGDTLPEASKVASKLKLFYAMVEKESRVGRV